MKRPFGVTIIAILALFSGLFGLCWPTLAFTGSTLLGGILGTISFVAGIFLIAGPKSERNCIRGLCVRLSHAATDKDYQWHDEVYGSDIQ
jgi:uncharacterized membrane protein HdeD (DUF308 family)